MDCIRLGPFGFSSPFEVQSKYSSFPFSFLAEGMAKMDLPCLAKCSFLHSFRPMRFLRIHGHSMEESLEEDMAMALSIFMRSVDRNFNKCEFLT